MPHCTSKAPAASHCNHYESRQSYSNWRQQWLPVKSCFDILATKHSCYHRWAFTQQPPYFSHDPTFKCNRHKSCKSLLYGMLGACFSTVRVHSSPSPKQCELPHWEHSLHSSPWDESGMAPPNTPQRKINSKASCSKLFSGKLTKSGI